MTTQQQTIAAATCRRSSMAGPSSSSPPVKSSSSHASRWKASLSLPSTMPVSSHTAHHVRAADGPVFTMLLGCRNRVVTRPVAAAQYEIIAHCV